MSAWRSLRVRTLLVACAVAFVPLPLVWVFGKTEPATRSVLLVAAKRAAEDAAASPSDLATVARQRRVRLRLIDPDGTVAADTSYEPDGPVAWLDRRFYGPDGIPRTLSAWDAVQPAVSERPLIARARADGEAAGCTSNEALTLLVCEAAVRTADGRIVFAQRSSHLAVRALYEDRWPMLQLALMVAALAVLLGAWLGWRVVRPIADLRTAALERVAHPLTAPPIGMDRGDEFGELAAAFDTLLAAVRQQASAHEAFVADLAHEMKNPVAAIRAAAEALQGEVSSERAERLSKALADSSGRLDRLITLLLELARAEAGLPREERRTLSLDALVRGVVSALAADERFADVTLHADTTGVLVAGDAGGLETALRNLLINAASFAGKGGRVDVRVARQGDRAVVEVRDSGPGIAAADLPRVFDRFFTTRPGQGTGLGLALVRAITLAHDGIAIALSPPGGGALFRLDLPAVDI